MKQRKHFAIAGKRMLLLTGSLVFLFGCNSHSNFNSNTGLNIAGSSYDQPHQTGTLLNRVEQASFKYTSSDLFKTGKISTPRLVFSADTLVHYNGRKYQVKLNYFDVQKTIFGVGSLTTGSTTVLLFTKEKQFHYFEVKGVGAFEFRGTKEDQSYFKLSLQDSSINFSLNLNSPEVRLTEYMVDAE
ncbi:hypothetical protein A3860_36355 [Niastella vici]|uniref:Uncharacterized protein n=1 Tax=Niastella vici TaxID=1703345 RepID=A0A1V9FN12_9BACT|nr:hypothetical protein [Niastella vici]OQP59754.1 hypothetical protein A3860_36355 [Niastella vici]